MESFLNQSVKSQFIKRSIGRNSKINQHFLQQGTLIVLKIITF